MNFADIKNYDVANGAGIRVSLFVSGCEHYCKNCFNSEAWDFNYGQKFTEETAELIVKYMAPTYIMGLSILGGEPLHPQNRQEVTELVKRVKEKYPTKTIWIYTGFTYEEVRELEVMNYIDVLVDGKFVEELKDLRLRFRGSSNQRILLVKESMKRGKAVEWK